TRWNAFLRGESSPARRSGIHRPRCTALRDGGSRASLALRSGRAQTPVSVPDHRVLLPSAVWRYRRADGTRCSPVALRTNILSVPLRPPATRSATTPLVGSQQASNLDAPHERARGQSVTTTAPPWLPAT